MFELEVHRRQISRKMSDYNEISMLATVWQFTRRTSRLYPSQFKLRACQSRLRAHIALLTLWHAARLGAEWVLGFDCKK